MGSLLRKRLANRHSCTALALFVLVAAILHAPAVGAQISAKKESYKVRLSPVPIDVSMMVNIAGAGSLTATLSGKQLTISGTFEGLRSPATTAHIHRGPKGIRGPAILDLTVTSAEKGAVSGTIELTPDQITDLRAGRLYVQIESQRAPDGNLWGWLLQ